MAEHIQLEDTAQTSIDTIYDAYQSYCKANPTMLSCAEKKTIGKVINHLFNRPALQPKMINGVKSNYYGITLLTDPQRLTLPKNNVDLLMPPLPNRLIQSDNEIKYIEYPMIMLFDDQPVSIEFSISSTTNMTWLSVRGQELDSAECLGYHFHSRLDQPWLESTFIIANKVELCKGMQIYFHLESSVPEIHMWKNTLTGMLTPAVHSKNCSIILPFTKTFKKEICDSCVHDLQ